MSERLTPLAPAVARLAALALFLAVLLGRPELLLVAAPLLFRLLAAALDPGPGEYDVVQEVSATRLFEGETVAVTVTFTARAGVRLLDLVAPLPPTVALASATNRAVVALEPGAPVRWTFTLRCPGRGRVTLGTVHARVRGRSGLRVVERTHAAPITVRVYPRIVPLRRLPHPRRTQTSAGNYVARTVGAGLEPGDSRPFAPGDRVKEVNWPASLRLGRLYVTQYHHERNADVVLMLDTLSQVGVPPLTSLDVCARAAGSLAAAYLARKDRVGLIDYGGVIHWVRPGSGRIQFERILDGLIDAQPIFTYVRKDLARVPPRVLPPEALVVALTPLIDPRFVQALHDLAGRGFDLVVLTPDPVAITRATLVSSASDRLACRLWAIERRAQLAELRRARLTVLDWDPAEPLEAALEPLGRHRRRVAALP